MPAGSGSIGFGTGFFKKDRTGFKILDAYRPYAATLYFYEVYHDTTFVASPRTGHS